jgi:hypothetical protein
VNIEAGTPQSTAPEQDPVALLSVPGLTGLTEPQVRGASCIWCPTPLTAETAIDLGERRHRRLDGHYSTFPRGCRPCTLAAAIRALADHAPLCEQCVDSPAGCGTAVALRRLMRECRR